VYATVSLICPETGEQVVLHKDCMDPNGDGNPCRFYKHFGVEGSRVVVACGSTKVEHLPHWMRSQNKGENSGEQASRLKIKIEGDEYEGICRDLVGIAFRGNSTGGLPCYFEGFAAASGRRMGGIRWQ